MSFIVFFTSFGLMALMVSVRSLEIRLGRHLFMSKIGVHADDIVLTKAAHAKHAAMHLGRHALVHTFRVSSHGAGMFYGFLRSKLSKARTDFYEALREKRVVRREVPTTSDFLKDVIAHKTTLREGR